MTFHLEDKYKIAKTKEINGEGSNGRTYTHRFVMVISGDI